ncbi:hypothetical protein [Streptomyces sp. NPDC048650]|uniref:hypothetical protein n=1 Tax=unclassified Streptomyces TaxID=2593676 RepID=UPI00371C8F2F
MTTPNLSPQEVARWALRTDTPLDAGQLDLVAATADHIQSVIGTLHALDLGETAPAAAFHATHAGEERPDAAV